MTAHRTDRTGATAAGTEASLPPLTSVDDALSLLLKHAQPVPEVETVPTLGALGRVVADDQVSAIDVPPYDNSAMDGYAVRSQDTKGQDATRLTIHQHIAAGSESEPLPTGCAARILTGAPVPAGADAVVMQEYCTVEDGKLRIDRKVKPGDNIRPRGNDLEAGSLVLKRGVKIRAQEMAVAASTGIAELPVYRRIRVAVFSTGDELAKPGSPRRETQLFESNRYAMFGFLEAQGCEVADLGIVPDEPSQLLQTMRRAANDADLVITSGGVSVGDKDFVRHVVQDLGELRLWRVAIKPGKPLAFGSVMETPFFGLPGNPVAVFVGLLLFVRPYLKRMQGIDDVTIRSMQVAAGFERSRTKNRREFVRAQLRQMPDGIMAAELYPKQGSDILSSMTWGDGLVEIPEQQCVKRGQLVRYLPFSELMS